MANGDGIVPHQDIFHDEPYSSLAFPRCYKRFSSTAQATEECEVGPDMSTFPSAAHLSSWAGLCPGNRRSAGKEKSGRTTRGNRWLRTTMTQCAWAASMTKDCYLKGKFWRLAAEGKKRAIVAIAHNLLVFVYHVLATGLPYQERGGPIEEHHKQRRIRHHLRALGRLGINVGCRPAT